MGKKNRNRRWLGSLSRDYLNTTPTISALDSNSESINSIKEDVIREEDSVLGKASEEKDFNKEILVEEKTSRDVTLNTGTTTTRSQNMAISLEKYVEITSNFPTAGLQSRSFGGLVFTTTGMLATAPSSKKSAYESGDIVQLKLSEVGECFGETSKEYEFANGYYGYLSPSGNIPSALTFALVKETTPASVDYAINTAYAVDAIVKQNLKIWKCIEAVSVEDNTSWDAVSSKFTEVDKTYETATAALTRVNTKTNQFGSFTFLDTTTHTFPPSELKSCATTNTGFDTKYLFVVNDVRGTQEVADVVTKKGEYSTAKGTVFVSGQTSVSAYMPMAIFASTNYDTGLATVQMFKQFAGETPSVQGDAEYEAFKAAYVNFYGRTQCNGTTIDFYQRGFNTDGTDTSIYCNEIWFKSACAAELITLLVDSERIPANAEGVTQVRATVLGICSSAAKNGSFMAKTLTTASERTIRQSIAGTGYTGLADDIIDGVATNGYYVYAYLTDATSTNDATVHYYVFYGTADSVRFIKGDDVLLK